MFLFCFGLLWLTDNVLPPLFDLSVSKWVIRPLLALGVLTGITGVIQFAIHSTTVNPHKPGHASSIVTSGVYKVSRNPMYLAMLFILLAAILAFGHPLGFIVLPFYVWYMNQFQIIPEESAMEEKFGDEYRNYIERVRRWI